MRESEQHTQIVALLFNFFITVRLCDIFILMSKSSDYFLKSTLLKQSNVNVNQASASPLLSQNPISYAGGGSL